MNSVLSRVVCFCLFLWGFTHAALAHEVFVVGGTERGGGELRIASFVERDIVVYLVLCDTQQCAYSASDPGFTGDPEHGGMTEGELSGQGLFLLAPTADLWLEIVEIAPEASVAFGRTVLRNTGDRILLGSGPQVHNHPSWRLFLREGERGRFPVKFRLTSTSQSYRASPVYRVWVTNLTPTPSPSATPPVSPTNTPTQSPASTFTPLPAATPTPTVTTPDMAFTPTPLPTNSPTSSPALTSTPTPSPSPQPACVGDCDGDREVTIDEIVRAVSIALNLAGVETCDAADRDSDGGVSIDEIVAAVNVALDGCRR